MTSLTSTPNMGYAPLSSGAREFVRLQVSGWCLSGRVPTDHWIPMFLQNSLISVSMCVLLEVSYVFLTYHLFLECTIWLHNSIFFSDLYRVCAMQCPESFDWRIIYTALTQIPVNGTASLLNCIASFRSFSTSKFFNISVLCSVGDIAFDKCYAEAWMHCVSTSYPGKCTWLRTFTVFEFRKITN